MELEVICGYEGSNPQDGGRIAWTSEEEVRVRPESEDGDSNYKFALDVTIHNRGSAVRALRVDVDWQEPPEVGTRYMANREWVFLQHEGSGLEEVCGQLTGDHVHMQLELLPGRTRLSLHPPFGSPELGTFFAQAEALPQATRYVLGQTAEGRPIEAVVLRALDRAGAAVLGIGRFHPYESAGSYCIWGVLDLLAGPRGEELRSDRTFVLVPIANPDGVAHGLCKRTRRGGVDLSAEGNGSNDPTACALRGLVAGVGSAARRTLLLDAHGWMNSEEGIWVCKSELGRAVVDRLQGELYPRGWRATVRDLDDLDATSRDLRLYAAQRFGVEPVVTSIPWFGRTPATMRRIGGEIAVAALEALA